MTLYKILPLTPSGTNTPIYQKLNFKQNISLDFQSKLQDSFPNRSIDELEFVSTLFKTYSSEDLQWMISIYNSLIQATSDLYPTFNSEEFSPLEAYTQSFSNLIQWKEYEIPLETLRQSDIDLSWRRFLVLNTPNSVREELLRKEDQITNENNEKGSLFINHYIRFTSLLTLDGTDKIKRLPDLFSAKTIENSLDLCEKFCEDEKFDIMTLFLIISFVELASIPDANKATSFFDHFASTFKIYTPETVALIIEPLILSLCWVVGEKPQEITILKDICSKNIQLDVTKSKTIITEVNALITRSVPSETSAQEPSAEEWSKYPKIFDAIKK